MPWQQKELLPPLPDEAQDLVNTVNSLAGSVVPVLDALATALGLAQTFFQSTDLFKALATALVTETENLVNDLFGSGAFELVVDPFSKFARRGRRDPQLGINLLTPGEAITAAIRSLDDTGDENRPQFSDSANVSAFGILVTAPDIRPFIELLKLLLSLWNIDDLRFTVTRLERLVDPPRQSRPPDWDSLRFNQIGALGDLQKEILNVLAIAKGYLAVPDDAITDLIAQLQRKVEVLTLSIAAFQALIDFLAATPGLAGVHVFDVPLGVGGNERLKAELPNEELQQLVFNNFTFFALYVGGGPSAAGVDRIRQLLVA